ncbi:hypothetical protein NDU88_007228 [Pleurodeles waltl]|uniref:Uncharacterized protein n=1 Tax=Pleurodeles waltl TaxID=8319 RepID=A0AAV7N2V3_PLEWA|nr:hypothetical protein NDU88_007228 [Pleurodeles waltl]
MVKKKQVSGFVSGVASPLQLSLWNKQEDNDWGEVRLPGTLEKRLKLRSRNSMRMMTGAKPSSQELQRRDTSCRAATGRFS